MNRFIITGLAGLTCGSWMTFQSAYGQVDTQVQPTSTAQVQKKGSMTAELKPVPTILSVIPGVGSTGVGAEYFASPNIATFANVYYADVNLPMKVSAAANKDNSDPTPDKLKAMTTNLGARYYGSPIGHTWYVGGAAGYTDSRGRWDYDEGIEIDHNVVTASLGADGGFRWKWDSGFLLRLGGTLGANRVIAKSITANSSSDKAKEGEDSVDDYTTLPLYSAIDVGVGYAF